MVERVTNFAKQEKAVGLDEIPMEILNFFFNNVYNTDKIREYKHLKCEPIDGIWWTYSLVQ